MQEEKVTRKNYYEKRTQDICDRCDIELERIRNNRPVSVTSQYRKDYSMEFFPHKTGFKQRMTVEGSYVGEQHIWNEAFEKFCKKKVNIYGKKVNRLPLLMSKPNQIKYGKGLEEC